MTTAFQIAIAAAVSSRLRNYTYTSVTAITAADFAGVDGGALIKNLSTFSTLVIAAPITGAFNGIKLCVKHLSFTDVITGSFIGTELFFEDLTIGGLLISTVTGSFLNSSFKGCTLTISSTTVTDSFINSIIDVQTVTVSNTNSPGSYNSNSFISEDITFAVIGTALGGTSNTFNNNQIRGKCTDSSTKESCEKESSSKCEVASRGSCEVASRGSCDAKCDLGSDYASGGSLAPGGAYKPARLLTISLGDPLNVIASVFAAVGTRNNIHVKELVITGAGTLYFSGGSMFNNILLRGEILRYTNLAGTIVSSFANSNINLCGPVGALYIDGNATISSGSFFLETVLVAKRIFINGIFNDLLLESHVTACEFKFPGTGTGSASTVLIASTLTLFTDAFVNIDQICIGITAPNVATGLFNGAVVKSNEIIFTTDPTFLGNALNLFTRADVRATQVKFAALANPTVWAIGTTGEFGGAYFEVCRFKSDGVFNGAADFILLKSEEILIAGDVTNSFNNANIYAKKFSAYSVTTSFANSKVHVGVFTLADEDCEKGALSTGANAHFFAKGFKVGTYIPAVVGPATFSGMEFLDLDVSPGVYDFVALVQAVNTYSIKLLVVNQDTIAILGMSLPELANLKVVTLKGTASPLEIPDSVMEQLQKVIVCKKLTSLECAKLKEFGLA